MKRRLFVGIATLVLGLWSSLPAQEAASTSGAEKEPGVTVVFNQEKLEQVAQAIEQQAGRQIDLFGTAKNARVDVIAKDRPLTEVLDTITGPFKLVWWHYDERKYAIADFETYADMVLRQPDLDAALKHLTETQGCTRADGLEGTILLTCPAESGVVRGGPEPVTKPLGLESKPVDTETEPKITVVFNQGKIEQVLMAISAQAQTPVNLRGSVAGRRVDILVREVPLSVALDKLCVGADFVWWQSEDGQYAVSDKEYFRKNVLGKGELERRLDALCPAHQRTWTKDVQGSQILYTLRKAAMPTSPADSNAQANPAAGQNTDPTPTQ